MKYRSLLVVFLLFLSFPVFSQKPDRTKDPTLNRGQGLEMDRDDLASMRNKKQDKHSRVIDLYMFGACFSVLDSTLYISDVRFVSNAPVNNKWFLKNRLDYERQFKSYVTNQANESLIPVVYFSENKKKVVRHRETLLKRSKKNGYSKIEIRGFDFQVPAE